jgi:RHS repeat-associated protein
MPSPAEDDRYIEIAYSPGYGGANQITRATLRNSAVPFEVQFGYNNSDGNLTKFIDNDGAYNNYYYSQDVACGGHIVSKSHYMNMITNKLGNASTFSCEYCSGTYGYWCTKLVMNSPNSLTTTYKRNNVYGYSTQCNVTCMGGGQTLRRINYWGGSHGYYTSLVYFYNPHNSSDYRCWVYGYIDDSANNNARLTKVETPSGTLYAQYLYTPQGRLSRVTAADGTYSEWTYSSPGDLFPASKVDRTGKRSWYAYNSNNQVTHRTEDGLSLQGYTYQYDEYGQKTKFIDPYGKETNYAYNKHGQVTLTTNPLGETAQMSYDDIGRLTRATDAAGKNTDYYYGSWCGGCSSGGQITKLTDALGKDFLFYYDGAGRLTKTRNALNHEVGFAYDIMGNMTSATAPIGSANTTTFGYDMLGRSTAFTDALGRTTTYDYDYCDNVTRVTDPEGTFANYAFDKNGLLTTVTDGLNHRTTLAYDNCLRLTRSASATSEITWYKRDQYGRVTKVVAGPSGDFAPTETFYLPYSGLVSKVRYTSGGTSSDVNYNFDGSRRLTSLVDWLGTIGYLYDDANRVTRIIDYDSSYTTYAYDSRGMVTAMRTYTSGGVEKSAITYTYTDTRAISSITAPGSRAWDYDYNDIGRVTRILFPNGMTNEYNYDNRDRLTRMAQKDGAAILDSFKYDLDAVGNIGTCTKANGLLWQYSYDGRNRMTILVSNYDPMWWPDWMFTYHYDGANNITDVWEYSPSDWESISKRFAYNNSNELTTFTDDTTYPATTCSFSYDPWGRMSTKTTNGTTQEVYGYKYGDKLCSYTTNAPGGSNVTYNFGGDGRRRSRTSGGVITKFCWDKDWNMVAQKDAADNLVMTYIHEPGAVGQVLADLAGATPAIGRARYYLHDNTGSTRRLRDADKASVGYFEYEGYGADYMVSGEWTPFRFGPSYQYDSATGLYQTPFRAYAPEFARWLSRDPLGMVDGPNVYEFIGGNPVSETDPYGLMPAIAAIVLVVVFAVLLTYAGYRFCAEADACMDALQDFRADVQGFVEELENEDDPIAKEEMRRRQYQQILALDSWRRVQEECPGWVLDALDFLNPG